MKFFKNFLIKIISNIYIFLLNKNKIPNLILNFNIKINETNNTFYHQEGIFKTDNNFKIPIYSNYRYSVKKGWKIFDGLNKLETLSSKKLLTNSEEIFFKEAVGNRQINKSISEINEVALGASKKNEDFFFHNPLNINTPILKPNLIDIKNKFYIEYYSHQKKLNFLNKTGILKIDNNSQLLEIGFDENAMSTFAFEKLGLNVTAIDNHYNLNSNKEIYNPALIANCQFYKSNIIFKYSDITKNTDFDDCSFDIIYSASVLEHIQDIRKAFRECFRILKPGGIMMHSYHPLFSYNGGHSLCTSDSPWGHILLNKSEFRNYLRKYRKYESNTAISWLDNALCYENTQKHVQLKCLETGFNILNWSNSSINRRHLNDLTKNIIQECLIINDNITLEDLLTENIYFIAQKPR